MVLLGAALAPAGCQPSAATPAGEAGGGVLEGLRPAITAAQARAALAQLTVAAPGSSRPYRRTDFGRRWADTDRDGCPQRSDVLFRDAVPGSVTVARRGSCGHDVRAGSWRDPYSGRLLTFTNLKDPRQAQELTIDHLVPIAEAFRSGADRWTAARREAFANDLENLLAVSETENSAKGSRDPASWLPRAAVRCSYAVVWVQEKSRWDLCVDGPERVALSRLLQHC